MKKLLNLFIVFSQILRISPVSVFTDEGPEISPNAIKMSVSSM